MALPIPDRPDAASGPRGVVLLSPVAMTRHLWSLRDMIRQFTGREIAERTRGTALGWVWLMITPLVRLAIYALVFGELLGLRFGDKGGEYAFFLFCGLIVYGVFSDAATKCSSVITSRPRFVKKLVFPTEILPVTVLGAGVVVALLELGLLIAGRVVLYQEVSPLFWLVPVAVAPMLMMALGLGWILASLNVFLEDTREIARLIIAQFLFFLTPIIYPASKAAELAEGGSMWIVRAAGWFIQHQPMTVCVEAARDVLLRGVQPNWLALGLVWLLGLVMMQAGFAFFMKSKGALADVL